jgi:hypothetical protein
VSITKVTYLGSARTAPMLNDGGRIAFIGGGTLYGLWNAGGYPASIVTVPSGTLVLGGLAADATNYYYSQINQDASGDLMAVPKGGGTPTNKYSSTGVEWFAVAVGGTTLYGTDYSSVADSWALPSGTAKTAPNCTTSGCRFLNVFGVAADANGAYLAISGNNAGAGQIVNWVGGNPLAVTSLPSTRLGAQGAVTTPYDIVIDASNVYWVANDAGASTDGTLMQTTRVVGGTPIAIATSQGTIVKIAVAGAYVYWTTAPATGVPGAIRRARIGTTNTVETLATDADPWGIAVVGTSLYWTSLGSGTTSVVGLAL